MHKALRASVDGFSEDSLWVTRFCIPTACFCTFIFQNEEKTDSESAILNSGHPEFQFAIEIPGFIQLPVMDEPVGEIHGVSGRTHRCVFRERKAKEQKLEETCGEDLKDGLKMDESPWFLVGLHGLMLSSYEWKADHHPNEVHQLSTDFWALLFD